MAAGIGGGYPDFPAGSPGWRGGLDSAQRRPPGGRLAGDDVEHALRRRVGGPVDDQPAVSCRREELVLATTYSVGRRRGDPNSGGNHRKSMVASVEESLRRLGTDYLDLLYLHAWDATTPVEEVLRAMDDLVAAGKTLYAGISDTPAWQVSRMQAIAALRGWAPLIALQVEYSLIERTPERDLIPMAREMGLGVIPWSPLASGVLTGKYGPAELDPAGGAADPEGTRKKRGRRERVADRAGPGHRRGGQGRRRRTRRHPPDDPARSCSARSGWTPRPDRAGPGR
jgi:hypothetical protein